MLVNVNITFNYKGTHITSPNMDETGRFEVKTSEYYALDEGEMEVIYMDGMEILLNYDGFNEVLTLLDKKDK